MKFKEQIGDTIVYLCDNAGDKFWAEQNHLTPSYNGELWVTVGTEGAKLLEEKVCGSKEILQHHSVQ